MIDGYASLFRKGLSAAAPMLQDLGAGEALGSGVKALQSYDTVRKQVMDVDEKGRGHYDRIAKATTEYLYLENGSAKTVCRLQEASVW